MRRINDLKIFLVVFMVFILFITLVSSEVIINYQNKKRYRILSQEELVRRKFNDIYEIFANIFDTKLRQKLEKYYNQQRFIIFNIQNRPYIYEIKDRENDEVILFT